MITEPARCSDPESLWPPFREKLAKLIERMEKRGFDPVVFEARRSLARQRWLYGCGRSHHQDRKPVTWTMTSKHLVGKAADIISHSRAWSWPEFYSALKEEAKPLGLTTIKQEACHVQWGR